jgi:hypothetical protein
MRSALFLLGLVVAGATPVLADCRSDVVDAFERQRKAGSFRMVANVIGVQGPMTMTLDYTLPDKLHQTVVMAIRPQQPIEAVLIGAQAWVNEGKGWAEANKDEKDELVRQLAQVSEETAESLGDFDCLGSSAVDGGQLKAFLAIEGPRDKNKKSAPVNKDNRSERIIFVDPTTGLPMRTILALPGKYDAPIFKAVYSYPPDIKIEAPVAKP